MATKRPRRSAPIPERIIEAALELAATENWASVTLGAIAEKAGVSLVQLHGTFGSKAAILDAFVEIIDHAVLAGIGKEDLSESPRDRLFDSLMRRLDALQPRKAAIGSILRGLVCDPLALACALPRTLKSMAWTLEAAGIPSSGPAGRIKTKGLAAIYGSTLRVWLGDESADMSRTMAHLDLRLRQADRLVSLIPSGPGANTT